MFIYTDDYSKDSEENKKLNDALSKVTENLSYWIAEKLNPGGTAPNLAKEISKSLESNNRYREKIGQTLLENKSQDNTHVKELGEAISDILKASAEIFRDVISDHIGKERLKWAANGFDNIAIEASLNLDIVFFLNMFRSLRGGSPAFAGLYSPFPVRC